MSDQPTPPLGTPGGQPGGQPGGEDRTQAFPTQPPVGYPTHPPAAYPPSGHPPAGPPPPGGYGGYGPPPATPRRTGVIAAAVVVVVLVLVATCIGVVLLTGRDDDGEAEGTTTTEDDRDEESTGSTTESTAPDAGDAVEQVVGSWTGSYTCAQGLTRLDLEIASGDGPDRVTATFTFSADPSNPGVPDGSFAMSGTATDDAGLVLEPGEWIDRPGDFTAVGLAAPLPSDPDVLAGTVEGASGCTTFELTRS